MTMDLTGITNCNEYYTNHYFSWIFADSAKEAISDWNARAKNGDFKTPWSRLRKVSEQYFALREQYQRPSDSLTRSQIVCEMANLVLDALDYPATREMALIDVEDELQIPVYLEMTKPNGAPLLWVMLSSGVANDGDILQDASECVGGVNAELVPDMTNENLLSNPFSALTVC